MAGEQLSTADENAFERYFRRRVNHTLAVIVSMAGALGVVVAWAIFCTARSLAEAAVNTKLVEKTDEIKRLEKDLVAVRDKAREQHLTFTRDLAFAESDTKRAALTVTELEQQSGVAKTRLQAAIRSVEDELSAAQSVVTASKNVSGIANALANDATFQNRIRDGLFALPIASIIAWNPTKFGLDKSPLPHGWVPCNGPITKGSPYYIEQADVDLALVPDLNQGRRFLRGSATSGDLEEDAVGRHTHRFWRYTDNLTRIGSGGGGDGWSGTQMVDTEPNAGDGETRPKNMSVIWIIRVK